MIKKVLLTASILLVGAVVSYILLQQIKPVSSTAQKGIHESRNMAYDIISGQKEVTTVAQLEHALKSLKSIEFEDLPKSYINTSKSDIPHFHKHLKYKSYYVIEGYDKYKILVGKFRVHEFMTPDRKYWKNNNKFFQSEKQYLLINKKMLYKLLELQDELEKNGYDRYALSIHYGHRHPAFNKKIKAASRSRHIYGEAVDLVVGDINKSGKFTQADRKIVYNLLNDKIIASNGGISRYPNSKVVHFDVRGYRARWESY
jgi:uncharacterized protein YcbK (DUF882 family)